MTELIHFQISIFFNIELGLYRTHEHSCSGMEVLFLSCSACTLVWSWRLGAVHPSLWTSWTMVATFLHFLLSPHLSRRYSAISLHLATTMATGTALAFWTIYLWNRELIHPSTYVFPPLLNHLQHSAPVLMMWSTVLTKFSSTSFSFVLPIGAVFLYFVTVVLARLLGANWPYVFISDNTLVWIAPAVIACTAGLSFLVRWVICSRPAPLEHEQDSSLWTAQQPALDGLRVLASFSIVLGHTWVLGAWNVKNVNETLHWVTEMPHRMWAQSLWLSVDVMFLLSGLLMTRVGPNRPGGVWRILWRRWIRLGVLYWTVNAIQKWGLGMADCFAADWTLIATPFVSRPTQEFCQPLGWSTQVDFIAWIAILALLVAGRRLGVKSESRILFAALIVSLALRTGVWVALGQPTAVPIMTMQLGFRSQDRVDSLIPILGQPAFDFQAQSAAISQLDSFEPMYLWTVNRITPLLMGALLRRRLSSPVPQSFLFALLGIIAVLFILVFNPYAYGSQYVFGWLYQTFYREIFMLGTASIIIALITPQSDALSQSIRWLLSASFFTRIAPFTYAIYLFHAFLATAVWFFVPPIIVDGSMTPMLVVLKALTLYTLTLIAVIPLVYLEKKVLRIVL